MTIDQYNKYKEIYELNIITQGFYHFTQSVEEDFFRYDIKDTITQEIFEYIDISDKNFYINNEL